ncbi:RHS repeat domain-containing protein, partial [Nocardioides plantarum]
MRHPLAAALTGFLAIALVVPGLKDVDAAATEKGIFIAKAPQEKQLPHETIAPAKRPSAGKRTPDSRPSTAVELPGASSARVTLPWTSRMTRAGDLPVRVGLPRASGTPTNPAASKAASSSTVEVRMLGETVADRAAVPGVMFTLRPTSGAGGSTRVELDYSTFADALGGSWGSRLHLVSYPACILTTPSVPECRQSEPVEGTNDFDDETLSATVSLDSSAPRSAESRGTTSAAPAVVMAAVAGASGAEGSFTATSLSASGSWAVAGSTGGFAWEYPLTLPAAGTGQGVTPDASVGYSSQMVDGQNTTSNNQSSWVGQGWSYEGGYLERTYRPCADDKSLPDAKETDDLCWAGPIVTLHMPGGSTTSLVKDDDTGEWHGDSDDGERVQLLTGANNGAWSGEHWVVTTTDGTRYTFGMSRLPGSTADEATDSAWTVPVYSPRSDDPCYDTAGFAESHCDMAYRWNLDLVEDVHGNAAVYDYAVEGNYYSSTADAADASGDRLRYDRGGYLTSIRYGLNTAGAGLFSGSSPQRIDFTVAERCFVTGSRTCNEDDFKVANAERWPDVPIDQACKATGSCDNHAPTFWSRKRLDTITTKYLDGTENKKVDSYDLVQHFSGDTGDELLLDSITRTAWNGEAPIVSPPVTFDMSGRANRVENSHNLPPMFRSRLHGIHTETGQTISVSYSGDDGQSGRAKPLCTASTLPASVSENTSECYPVRWTPPYEDEILDYFHKYVVTQVNVEDAQATAPDRITTYHYLNSPAWHYDDNEVLRPKYRTWSQFRGYAQVETRTGNANSAASGSPDVWTSSKAFYYRGMDEDRLYGGGRRQVTIKDSENIDRDDDDAFTGETLETQYFNGVGGELVTKTIQTSTIAATTATRSRGSDLDPVKALMVRPSTSTTYTTKAAGGFTTSGTTSKYDAQGRAVEVTSTASSAPTSCIKTTYAENLTTWVRDKARETTTYEDTCPTKATPSPPIRRASRTYYDGSSTLGAVTQGDATRSDAAKSLTGSTPNWVSSTADYDPYGRPLSSTVNNPDASPSTRTTTTTYNPSGRGALRDIQTTLPLSTHSTRTWFDPARGNATKTTDVAGLVTEGEYDALGRLTSVWRPGQTRGTDPATETYTYLVRPDEPIMVTSKTLVDRGNGAALSYQTRVVIYDAFGEIRQAQADAAGGGRVVTDNFTDSHGWSVKSYDHWYTAGAPETKLIGTTPSGIDDWKTTTYDPAGRPTVVTGRKRASTITSTTRTIYGGDRVTTIQPAGGVTTTAIVNGRGNQVWFDQYLTPPTVNGNVVSGGTKQRQRYVYDSIGQQLQQDTAYGVTGKEATWTNTYDLLGRVTSAVSPDSGNTQTEFYDTGEVRTRTDAANRVVAYTYDALGRPLTRRTGSVTGAVLASWDYDTLMVGMPTSSTSVENGSTYTRTVTGYDSRGNALGTTVGLSDSGFKTAYTSSQTFTKTNLLATSTYASTLDGTKGLYPETLTYSYDALGNPTSMYGQNSYVTQADYTPYGEPSRQVLETNNETMTMIWERDAKTRNIISTSFSGSTLAAPQIEATKYSYDAAGNIIKTVNQQGSLTGGPVQTQCFDYDGIRQLVGAWSSTDDCATNPADTDTTSKVGGPQPYWLTFDYDAGGSRTSRVKHTLLSGGTDSSISYTMGAGGRVHALASTKVNGTASTSYTYNADGAMKTRVTSAGTTNFAYGPEGALASVATPGGTSTYVEDAEGEVLLRKDPTSTTLYLPGQEVKAASDGTLAVTKYYSFNGRNVAIREGKSAAKYVIPDIAGSNQVSVDPVNGWAVSRRYLDPFGNTLANSGGAAPGTLPGSRTFLNQPANATTSLVDMGARLYDPSIGRFTSVDPVLSPNDPQAANGYTYASNNPVNFTDASGLMHLATNADGGRHGSSYNSKPPPPSFMDGFIAGAGQGAIELIDSITPSKIVEGLKNLIKHPPNPIAFFKTVVKSVTHFDDFKAIINAWNDHNEFAMGQALGKLLVSVGGDLV